MLVAENLRKVYKKAKEALSDFSLQIDDGSIVVIYGENGAGKTTFLKIVAGFLLPDSGRVVIDGIDITANPNVARKLVSIATGQERSFYYRLSIKENLKFFGVLNNLAGRELERKVEKIMYKLGLVEYENVKYMELSKGYKKRLDIARALLKDARVYIFDEPCSGVDMKTRRVIHEIADELRNDRKIVLMASHEIEDASVADRVVVMKRGRKVAELPGKKCDRFEIEALL